MQQRQRRKLPKFAFIQKENRRYFPHCWSDKGFNGTVVNQEYNSLNAGSLELTPNSINLRHKYIWSKREELRIKVTKKDLSSS